VTSLSIRVEDWLSRAGLPQLRPSRSCALPGPRPTRCVVPAHCRCGLLSSPAGGRRRLFRGAPADRPARPRPCRAAVPPPHLTPPPPSHRTDRTNRRIARRIAFRRIAGPALSSRAARLPPCWSPRAAYPRPRRTVRTASRPPDRVPAASPDRPSRSGRLADRGPSGPPGPHRRTARTSRRCGDPTGPGVGAREIEVVRGHLGEAPP